MSDLVKRLRHDDEYEPLGHDAWEAADRIEELEAALREIKDLLSYAGQDACNEAVAQGNKNMAWHIAKKALDTA